MSGYREVRRLLGGKYRAVITTDDCAENPFRDDDVRDDVRLVQFHRNYGTKHGFEDQAAVDRHCADTGAVGLPAYLTEHSAVHYSTSQISGWDSGRIGYVLFEKDYVQMIAKRLCAKPKSKHVVERLKEIAESMLSVYTAYANGYVYVVQIFEGDEEWDAVDETSGLYGDDAVDQFIDKFVTSLNPPPPPLHFMPAIEAFV